jgi:serine/threonine-protein kinase
MAKVKLLDPSDSKRRLDRYELIGELASGGMATVYLARLAGVGGFQRFVAIKRLHPHLAGEEEFIEMFLDEARLAAGIHHPHVVPILEVGQSDSGYYLVMEYIEGDTLARIVARALSGGPNVPRPILLRIVLDTLAGLHAAHELTDAHGQSVSLIHRDCSPQNVLVGVDGCSRITDFGVARASSRIASTRTDRVKGKLAYMSPEQARGDGDIDRRSDVFAMGVILWEVLAGRRLFKAETEAKTMRRIMIEPIPRLSTVLADIHPALDDACARALERDPDRRFQSAAEMADGLERAARVAATSTTNDAGVASPREVAAYVQGALGQDIAAQRESVRAWIAHSEPSLPAISARELKAAQDVTAKLPRVQRSGPVSERMSSVSPTSPPARNLTPAPMPRTLIGAAASAGEPTGSADEASDELLSDDTDQHETHLMMRDDVRAQLARTAAPVADRTLRSSPDFQEPTPLASTGARSSVGPSRRPRMIALAVGVLALIGGLVLWTRLRDSGSSRDAAPDKELGAGPAEGHHDLVPIASALPPSSPPPEVVVAAAPGGSGSPEKPAVSAAATGHKAAPVAAPPSKRTPPTAPTKPPPAGGGEDLANPYR